VENLKVIRVEVWGCHDNQPTPDNQWLQALHSSGFTSVTHCFPSQLYFINGQFSLNDIQHLSSELLADPVTEHFSISAVHEARIPVYPGNTIEVTLLPGVTDPAAENLLRAAHLLGLTGIEQVATGKRYVCPADLIPKTFTGLPTRSFLILSSNAMPSTILSRRLLFRLTIPTITFKSSRCGKRMLPICNG